MELIGIGFLAAGFALYLAFANREIDQPPPPPDPDPPAYFEPVEQMRQARARAMQREAIRDHDHPA